MSLWKERLVMWLFGLVLAAALLSAQENAPEAPGQAVAESRPNAGRERDEAFRRLDVDGNAVIERNEWPGGDRFFQRLDSDRNGALSTEEFLSSNADFWNVLFEDLDVDRNRVVTRSEWFDSEETFKIRDRDRNGVIDRFEFYRRS